MVTPLRIFLNARCRNGVLKLSFQHLSQPVEPLGQQFPRAGDVQADEIPAGLAVYRPGVYAQFRLFEQLRLQLVGRKPRCPAVDPHQICSLQRQHRVLRQVAVEILPQESVVVVQVFVERIEPFGAFVVGCDQRFDGEGADLPGFVDLERVPDPCPQGRIRREDVGDLATPRG